MKKSLAWLKGPSRRSLKIMMVLSIVALLLGIPVFMAVTAVEYMDPDQITFRLEGCNLDHGGIFDQPSLTCNDDGYTTGNLGKSWAELDLVPHRVTLDNGGDLQSYVFIVAGDYKAKAGDAHTGWDAITPLVKNTADSDPSCPEAITESEAGAPNPVFSITPPGGGTGGADQTIYSYVKITEQQPDTICVYDYAQRLSLGASEFSGSSLQSNLWNQYLEQGGVGQKRIQLPVAEIAPQELRKDMSASQDATYVWNIYKDATPTDLNFGDTCVEGAPLDKPVEVTIQWEKLEGDPYGIDVITNIYVSNPSHRDIEVEGTDVIYSGTVYLTEASFGPAIVGAGLEEKVYTHYATVDADATDLNDIVTVTYHDVDLPNVEIPGQNVATASAPISPDQVLNASAEIHDAEEITGEHLSFSVGSFSPDVGDFDGYTAGVQTVDPVLWDADTQWGDGSVTFYKTVYLAEPAITSGQLSDRADLTGSDGYAAHATAEIDISASALVNLTINKSIPDVLGVGESTSFTFNVSGPEGDLAPVSIDFGAGETFKSATLLGLPPGTYTVTEVDPSAEGWDPQAPQSVDIVLPACSGSVTFDNTFDPARAQVRKVTIPAGAEADWDFTLNGPGGPVYATTTGTGFVEFDLDLQEGSYTITETPKPGWDETGSTGCAFTVDYPADAGRVFECTKDNTQRGAIIVEKQTDPDGAVGDFVFTGDVAGTISDDGQLFTYNVIPGTYYSTEGDPTPGFDLDSIVCDDANSSGDVATREATFNVEAGETVKCTFTNIQRGMIIVEKQTDPDGAVGDFVFTGDVAGTISDDGQLFTYNVVPGTYYSTEGDPTPGFDLDSIVCDDANSSGDVAARKATFNVEAGETVKCTFTNIQRGTIIVEKQTDPDGAAGDFVFTGDVAGTISDDGQLFTYNVVPGTYYSTEGDPTPGFDLDSIVCDDANSSGDVAARKATFNVEAGETVKCTFTNIQRGTIIVEKQTDPDGAAGDFVFTGDVAGTISDDGQLFTYNVVPGTYYSTEGDPTPGFDLDSIVCDDANSSGDVAARKATFNVEAGETVKCTFTNIQRGTIIVEKQTDPDGAVGDFVFTGDVAGTISDDGQLFTYNVVPGTYYSTEGDPTPGFDLDSIVCDDANSSGDVAARKATFNVEAGETVKCTFTNIQRGTIIVEKQTDPDGAAGDFVFTGDVAGTISDDGQLFTYNVVPGTYYSTEGDPTPGFDLDSIVCDDANSSGDVAARKATFNVEAGETVKCTFTNIQRGTIIVEKQTDPDGAVGDFVFTGDVAGTISDDGQLFTYNVVPGTYYSTEGDPTPGFDLDSIVCDDANSSGDVAARKATFNVEAGETVKCTFTNIQRGKIIVHKTTIPSGADMGFGYTATYDADGFSLKDGEFNDSGWLQQGHFSVAEDVPSGWTLTDLTCESDLGSAIDTATWPTADIDLIPGDIVDCYFENTGRGSLKITKHIDWNETTPIPGYEFTICIEGPSYPDGDCRTFTDGHTETWTDLMLGWYTITEPGVEQWWGVGISPNPVEVVANETAEAIVTNKLRFWAFTPGFWKNHWGDPEKNQKNAWQYTDYPDAMATELCTEFPAAADYVACGTLVDALNLGGGPGDVGGAMILLRAGTAALLNASFHETLDVEGHPAAEIVGDALINPVTGLVYYPWSVDKIKAEVNTALEADREAMLTLAGMLDGWNNGIHYINWDWVWPPQP